MRHTNIHFVVHKKNTSINPWAADVAEFQSLWLRYFTSSSFRLGIFSLFPPSRWSFAYAFMQSTTGLQFVALARNWWCVCMCVCVWCVRPSVVYSSFLRSARRVTPYRICGFATPKREQWGCCVCIPHSRPVRAGSLPGFKTRNSTKPKFTQHTIRGPWKLPSSPRNSTRSFALIVLSPFPFFFRILQ